MPLEATHIKFALDLKDKYLIQDVGKYLSGTIYPDSRYITKIDRELTHGDYLLSPDFASNDFKKGWAVHFVCDRLFNKITDKNFPEYFNKKTLAGLDTKLWMNKTVLKIILDIEVLKKIDIQQYLPMLDYIENPNDEPIEKIKLYNRIIQELYGKKEITFKDIEKMWVELGVEEKLAGEITKKSGEFAGNPLLIQKIRGLYDTMLASVDLKT